MALCTKSGATAYANHAFLDLFGYTRTELEAGNIRWNEITPSGGRARDLEAIAELEVRDFCTPYEKVYTHKDAHPIPIFIGGGSFDEHVGTGVLFAVDLSRRKREKMLCATAKSAFERLSLRHPPRGRITTCLFERSRSALFG